MKYPFKEVKVIIYRWIIGCTSGLFFYIFLQKGKFPWEAVFAIYIGLLFVLPISSIMYLFESEMIVKKILDREIFYGVEVQRSQIPYFGYFRRILFSILAIAITPITIMGFIIYSIVSQTLSVKDPVLHVILLMGQALASMIIVSYSIAKALKFGLRVNNKNLELLGKGKFVFRSSRISCDEFGEQASLIGIISQNLHKMYQEITDLNQNLDKKVKQRTAELNNSLDEIKFLKEKQDGDYFLTSLILKPLFKNFNKSLIVKTEFFIRQYKQFIFKNKSGELGGDICITGNLLFYNQPYTMIVNADAMGKSMQGAGGAIVFGTVMNDLMSRSASKKKNLNMSPKEWLKEAFESLHGVFITFDGSMLISCTMGLLDENTGKFYYFNAEHPRIVLYRDNLASFLGEENLELRKLGSQIQIDFSYLEFELKPNDILIFGTDGRDDILIQNSNGEWNINQDENLFLKIVENSNANLEAIYKNLSKTGKIMDDLSLIRVEYTPQKILENKIVNYLKNREYNKVLDALEETSFTNIQTFSYYKGFCLYKLGKFNEAIDFLKMSFEQKETRFNASRLLAKIYYKNKEFQKALQYRRSL
jgi:hypothetical protein